ncbi:GNAT family N-acetyltransferase [Streptomyces sp. NPDC046203]|uniref:GNAT family N-acetyltransferase n=1 Tax=Streptomyces sp. NPDC046203 TaxID=3154602 RepID=UPI00340F804D
MDEITTHLTAAATSSAPALLLRPWAAEDVPALAGFSQDTELRRRTTFAVDDEADAARWIHDQERGWESGERFAFAVLEVEVGAGDGKLVGNAALKRAVPGSASAEVGYWTAAQARGRGVAPRALEAVTDWAFATFGGDGLKRIELLHQVDNTGSCRVAEKGGYVLSAILSPFPPDYPLEGHLHALER